VGDVERRSLLGAALGLGFASPVLAAAKPRVAIHTGRGLIVVELEATRAPLTSANFLHYVDAGKYDGGTFFRTVRTPGRPEEGQIVGQTAPKQRPFPPIAHESTLKTGLHHLAGTLSLGRFELGSATSNFFICVSPEPYLDAHPEAKGDNQGFAAFGQVVSGMEVVRRIHASPTGGGASPFADQRNEWLHPPIPIRSMKRV
jgi:peptidyl-prolyl cis-trans isomerase A (cyclophilin A)